MRRPISTKPETCTERCDVYPTGISVKVSAQYPGRSARAAYFRLTETKRALEEIDGWLRRKLRCILWRQWKRPYTRAKNLMKAGLMEERAFRSAFNQRGPWWNSGASHMNAAFRKSHFDRLGLVSLLDTTRRFQCLS